MSVWQGDVYHKYDQGSHIQSILPDLCRSQGKGMHHQSSFCSSWIQESQRRLELELRRGPSTKSPELWNQPEHLYSTVLNMVDGAKILCGDNRSPNNNIIYLCWSFNEKNVRRYDPSILSPFIGCIECFWVVFTSCQLQWYVLANNRLLLMLIHKPYIT